MIITYIHRIGWFIGLVLLQVLILNSVHLPAMLLLFSISILF